MVPAPKIRSCPFCCIIAIGHFCPTSEAYLCSNPEICPPKMPPMPKDVAGIVITKKISITYPIYLKEVGWQGNIFIYSLVQSCVLSDPVCEPGKICVSWNGEGEGMGTCKPRCLTNSDCMENEICETTGPDLPCFIGNCACLGSRRNSGKSFIGYIKWGI